MGRPIKPNKSYQSPIGGWYIIEIESKKHGIVRTIVDNEDYEYVKDVKWSLNGTRPHLYVCGLVNGKIQRLTRFLFEEVLPDEKIDHINGDTLDNRRHNLRVCSHSENLRNQRRNNNKGISYSKKTKTYRVRITVDGVTLCVGNYDKEEEATKAYTYASKFFHKEFSNAEI